MITAHPEVVKYRPAERAVEYVFLKYTYTYISRKARFKET